ncbi:MAG TPA: hypothetical protein VFB69_03945 [Candidatus Dormibacteraeota bacterium]|nr:hypothetical protein [Candidatus Dormibacteraeota bacterium]
MEEAIARELLDREAWALALFAAVASALIVHDWQVALIGFVGTLTVRCIAGVVLHGTHPPPRTPFPDLSRLETEVAWYVYRGRGDPAIARRTAVHVDTVDDCIREIKRKWHVKDRAAIARHVADILGEEPVHAGSRKRSREWLGESGWGIGVMAVGVGILAVSPDTAVLGGVRTWLGLGLMAVGLMFVAISTITYLWEKWHDGGPG